MIHGSRDTKTTLQVLIAVCSLALPVCAMDIEAITARPTADNPRFDNEEAWSVLVGDEYFTKENWPEATRLLIWGLVDENGRSKNGDPRIAANWTDAATGKPAETLPDMDTDVIVPDSDQPYEVYAKLKPKITIWIGAETKIENARFDDLHRGGIVVPDASAAAKWKNVTFGKGCLSKDPKELIREYKGKMNRGQPAEPLKPGKEYTSM